MLECVQANRVTGYFGGLGLIRVRRRSRFAVERKARRKPWRSAPGRRCLMAWVTTTCRSLPLTPTPSATLIRAWCWRLASIMQSPFAVSAPRKPWIRPVPCASGVRRWRLGQISMSRVTVRRLWPPPSAASARAAIDQALALIDGVDSQGAGLDQGAGSALRRSGRHAP